MKKTAASLAAAACLLAASAAHAGDGVTFPGFAHGSQTVTFTLGGTNPAKTATVYAGGFSTLLDGGASFTSYCVDLYQTINFGAPAYTDYHAVGGLHLFANSDAYADLGKLFGSAGPITDALHEAAFQIAVWEIAYETDATYDLGHGAATFSGGTAASSGALTLASSWLAGLGSAAAGPTIGVLESATHQDVIYAPIPEPSTVVLMVMGLLGMATVAKRRGFALGPF